jgi:hypothetical protein
VVWEADSHIGRAAPNPPVVGLGAPHELAVLSPQRAGAIPVTVAMRRGAARALVRHGKRPRRTALVLLAGDMIALAAALAGALLVQQFFAPSALPVAATVTTFVLLLATLPHGIPGHDAATQVRRQVLAAFLPAVVILVLSWLTGHRGQRFHPAR